MMPLITPPPRRRLFDYRHLRRHASHYAITPASRHYAATKPREYAFFPLRIFTPFQYAARDIVNIYAYLRHISRRRRDAERYSSMPPDADDAIR